jgi:hypothetical protein
MVSWRCLPTLFFMNTSIRLGGNGLDLATASAKEGLWLIFAVFGVLSFFQFSVFGVSSQQRPTKKPGDTRRDTADGLFPLLQNVLPFLFSPYRLAVVVFLHLR